MSYCMSDDPGDQADAFYDPPSRFHKRWLRDYEAEQHKKRLADLAVEVVQAAKKWRKTYGPSSLASDGAMSEDRALASAIDTLNAEEGKS